MQTTLDQSSSWNAAVKILFRFFFIYLILYIIPFPLTAIPWVEQMNIMGDLWHPLIVWTGKHILHLDYEIDIRPNGSGDTTWNYVQVFLIAATSLVGCVVWSVIDRKRMDYDRLYLVLSIFLRYYLATMMIGYGLFKIIKTQFPFPHIGRLIQPYGESSPMGLLWTFMGYSTAYNFFTGFAEALGGFLLFFRKTRLLGCLICIAVMSNVTMLNFTYDVPVKLLSSHLLFIAFFLAVPDGKRLLNFFFLQKPVAREEIQPYPIKGKWYYAYAAGKFLFITAVIVPTAIMSLNYLKSDWGDGGTKPPFYGYFDVEIHVSNGDTIPPLTNDTRGWKRVFVNSKEWAEVEYMDDSKIAWKFSADTLQKKVKLVSMDSSLTYTFTYEKHDNVYTWEGGDTKYNLYFKMNHKAAKDFLLVNRGFHWINERPYNR